MYRVKSKKGGICLDGADWRWYHMVNIRRGGGYMKKRTLAMFLATMMLLSLAGCGKKEEPAVSVVKLI